MVVNPRVADKPTEWERPIILDVAGSFCGDAGLHAATALAELFEIANRPTKLLAEDYHGNSQRSNSLRLGCNCRWVGSNFDATRYQRSVPLICPETDCRVNQSVSEIGGGTKALQQYRKLADGLGRPPMNLICHGLRRVEHC